ncbi:MAG: hypothetical protein K2O18_16980, partial [Oscillospiraceae bacterium]|nr:hypothetical protein [Oscillospiraceae bacterium]
ITDAILGSALLFRFPANESQFASAAVTVTLPDRADGPTLVLDRSTMTVNTTTNMEYAVDDVWMPAPANMDISSFYGHTMKFRYAAAETSPASSITELEIPTIILAPVLSLNMTGELLLSSNGSKILEYSEDNGVTWNSCTMPMEIGDLGGRTLLFRTPADGTNPCSDAVTAYIPARANAPEVSFDMKNEVLVTSPETGIAYSTDNGKTWISGKADVSDLTGEAILVRVACTAENMASEPVAVIVPNRKPAPALSIDMVAETVNTDSSMEVSVDGGKLWMAAGEHMEVTGLSGSTMLIRYTCTDTMFHSESVILVVPERQDAPNVSVNFGRFEAPDGTEFSSDGGNTLGRGSVRDCG